MPYCKQDTCFGIFLFCTGIGKPPWSLWLYLCLKFTAQLRDLTDNCMCEVQTVAHSPCNLLCDLLSTVLLLNLFRLEITKGLNTYSFLFLYICKNVQKHKSTLTLWGILCRPVTQHLNLNLGCNNMWKKFRGAKYFLKALYTSAFFTS